MSMSMSARIPAGLPGLRVAAPTTTSVRWLPSVALAVLCGLGAFFFEPVFESWGFLVPPVIGALVIALTISLLADRIGMRTGDALAVHCAIAVFALPGLLGLSSTWHRLPTLKAIAELPRALAQGPTKLLTVAIPARSGEELLSAPVASAWIGFVLGWALLRNRSTVAWSVVGPLLIGGTALSFGPIRSEYGALTALLFASAAMLYAATVNRSTSRSLQAFGHRRGPGATGPLCLIAVIAAAAAISPTVSRLYSDERFTFREIRTPPFDPGELPSPLAELRKFTTEKRRDDVLFSVKGNTNVRWRLAVLPAYDGRVWAAGSAATTTGASFEIVGARLHQASEYPKGMVERATVTAERLNEQWLPVAGPVLSVSMPKTQSAMRAQLRYNLDSDTLVAASRTNAKDRYEIRWIATPEPSDVAKATASFAGAPVGLPEPLKPSVRATAVRAILGDAATQMTSGATTDWEKVEGLRRGLEAGYFSEETPPGHALGDLVRMVDTSGLMQGGEEHYAALFAVLARSKRIPVRVVVGFEPKAAPTTGTVSYKGSDLHAWPEVQFADLGWVPVKLKIDKSRKPQPKVVQNVDDEEQKPDLRNVVPTAEPPDSEYEVAKPPKVEKPKRPGFRIPTYLVVGSAALLGPLLLAAAFVGTVSALKIRRTRRRRSRRQVSDSIAGVWEELFDRSRELGVGVPSSATFAEAAPLLQPDEARRTAVASLLKLTERASYGPDEPTETERATAWSLARDWTEASTANRTRFERLRTIADPRPLLRPATLA